jgi:hypothetical protein
MNFKSIDLGSDIEKIGKLSAVYWKFPDGLNSDHSTPSKSVQAQMYRVITALKRAGYENRKEEFYYFTGSDLSAFGLNPVDFNGSDLFVVMDTSDCAGAHGNDFFDLLRRAGAEDFDLIMRELNNPEELHSRGRSADDLGIELLNEAPGNYKIVANYSESFDGVTKSKCILYSKEYNAAVTITYENGEFKYLRISLAGLVDRNCVQMFNTIYETDDPQTEVNYDKVIQYMKDSSK